MGGARRPWWMNKWTQPAFFLALGVIVWVAFWAGGDPASGPISFAIPAASGIILVVGGKSETVPGNRGAGRDERWAMIDMRATALAGVVVITAIIVGFVVEIARGHNGNPYTWLGALAGATYLAGLLVGRARS